MHVTVIDNPDGTVVVTVRGNLDVDSGGVLLTTLDQPLGRPVPRIVVDLSDVGFCDTSGLSAFVVAHNRAVTAGGWVRLAAPHGQPAELLESAGLTGPLAVHPSVADALAAP